MSDTPEAVSQTAVSWEQLAAEIAQLHAEILSAARTSLDKAIRIGGLLAVIKGKLDDGEWLPWLKANVPFTDRTARNYLRVFENRDRLKTQTVADLREAYRLLAAPREHDISADRLAGRREEGISPDQWAFLEEQFGLASKPLSARAKTNSDFLVGEGCSSNLVGRHVCEG